MHREPKYRNVNEGRNLKKNTSNVFKAKIVNYHFNRKTNIQVTLFFSILIYVFLF